MKSDREEEIPYTWNIKRNDTNELTKQKETHRLRSKLMIARGRDSYGLRGGHVHTAMFKMGNLTNTYCVAHGTLLSVLCQPGWEGDWRRMDTCICMAESLHSSPDAITALSTQNISVLKHTHTKQNINWLSSTSHLLPAANYLSANHLTSSTRLSPLGTHLPLPVALP